MNHFGWLYDFFIKDNYDNHEQDNERKELLPALAMAQQGLSLVSVIQNLVSSDKNSATSNEVEEIIKAKIDDPIDKLSTEVLDQINESVGADATHKFNSLIDLVKGK